MEPLKEKSETEQENVNILRQLLSNLNLINKSFDPHNKTHQQLMKELDVENENIIKCLIGEVFVFIPKHLLSDVLRCRMEMPRIYVNTAVYINFLCVLNSIFKHKQYYTISSTMKLHSIYNNTNFDDYLLTRGEFLEIFTVYIETHGARPLAINEDGFYNYVPINCFSCDNSSCFKAHNDYEYFYHPILYKKFPCMKNCHKDECSFYHTGENMNTELNFENQDIKTLIKYFQKNDNEFKSKYDSFFYFNCDRIATEFNPNTYKIFKCPLGKICKLNEQLCLNYHSFKDRRRNLIDFNYSNEMCKNVINSPTLCPKGDNCGKCHNKYEFYYHPKSSGKTNANGRI